MKVFAPLFPQKSGSSRLYKENDRLITRIKIKMIMVDIRDRRPFIISGPCSAETERQTLDTCRALAASGRVDVLRAGVWKPRTRPGTFEGSGVRGLAWLARAKEETGLPVAVEVATSKHVENALAFGVDMVWIGARTTGNPFSVQDIADALRGSDVTVLVKNPMNPDLDLWAGAIARLENVGIDPRRIGMIHRGFSYFGSSRFRNAPMWHLAIEMRSRYPDMPMICDPSHICGNRELLGEVSQKAADMRFDGLIVESHICPAEAWSDASQQLTPGDFVSMIDRIAWRAPTADNPEFVNALEKLRTQIDQIDAEVFDLLSRRMQVADNIGRVKKDNNVAILQGGRWTSIVEKVMTQSAKLGLSEEFLRTVLEAIHIESINRQNKVMNEE